MPDKLVKLWPYALGVVMLLATLLFAPQVIRSLNRPTKVSGPGSEPGNSESVKLPNGLQPIRLKQAPVALYRVLADMLISKLRPTTLQTSFKEYETLAISLGEGLRTNMGVMFPEGYAIPKSIPQEWLEQPSYDTMQEFGYVRDLNVTNRNYMQRLVTRMLDECSAKTLSLVTEHVTEVINARKPGDESALSFVKLVYGKNFVSDYATARIAVVETVHGKQAIILPPQVIAQAEAEVASFWRTEFTDQEITAARDFLLQGDLALKLHRDFLQSNMPEAEKGLMESTLLGYRVCTMHDLTVNVVAAYCAKVGKTSNN
jgi:hypothetical protein